MTRTFFFALLLFCFSNSYGQSFEGTLTYKVEFEIKTQKTGNFDIIKEQVIEKMKSEGEFYDEVIVTIKNGTYEKTDNADVQKRIVYKPDVNKIYTFQKDFQYVVVTDASKTNLMNLDVPEPAFEKFDSTKIVNGHECSLLKLTWDKVGAELYYYDSEFLKVDPRLFQNHNYEYLNKVLEITKSYPIEIVKLLGDFIKVRMTLINVSESEIEDSHFNLPDMTKAKKEYAEMMQKLTGAEVKKIKASASQK